MARLKDWKLWIGSLLSVLLLYLALRNVNPKEVIKVIKNADLYLIGISIFITMLQHLIRTWRWKLILAPLKNTAFGKRFSSILIGFGANCILPARLGEIIRAYYLGSLEKISRVSVLGTIVIERLFDGTTLLVVLILTLILSPISYKWLYITEKIKTTGIILLILYAVLIFIFIILRKKRAPSENITKKLLFFMPPGIKEKIIEGVSNFIYGLMPAKDTAGFIKVASLSAILWATHLFQIKIVTDSVGAPITFNGTFLVLTLASFGVLIPSAPGFIGTFHFAVMTGLIILGLSKETALSSAIIWHAVFYFPTIISAIISFMLTPISIKDARKGISERT